MTVQYKLIEFPIVAGLNQKDDEKLSNAPTLSRADNIEFDKRGAANKRQGYTVEEVVNEAFGGTVEETFTHLAIYEDELLVVGYDKVYAVGDVDGLLPGNRMLVERGVIPRGNIQRQDVATSHTSRDTSIIPQ